MVLADMLAINTAAQHRHGYRNLWGPSLNCGHFSKFNLNSQLVQVDGSGEKWWSSRGRCHIYTGAKACALEFRVMNEEVVLYPWIFIYFFQFLMSPCTHILKTNWKISWKHLASYIWKIAYSLFVVRVPQVFDRSL